MADKTYIAVNEIRRTKKPGKAKTATSPAVSPVVETIVPGTQFTPKDAAERDELLSTGAIREEIAKTVDPAAAEEARKAADAAAAQKAAKTQPPTNVTPATKTPKGSMGASKVDDDETPADYSGLTVEQLQDELKKRELTVSGNKAELIARLEENDTPLDLSDIT